MLWPPLGDVKNKGGEQDRTTQNGGVKNFGQNPQERQIILKKVILDTFWKNMSQKKSTPLPAGQNKSWSPHTGGQKTWPPFMEVTEFTSGGGDSARPASELQPAEC